MAKYTTELRSICESLIGLNESVGYRSVNSVIKQSAPLLFDFEYPIFDSAYKSVLEQKIIKHFYMREIAFETAGLFRLRLETKMGEIMPYYNQLYKSELYEFNPFYDVDLTKTYDRSTDGNQSNETIEHGSGTDTTGFSQLSTSKDTGTVKNDMSRTEHGNETGNSDSHESGTATDNNQYTDVLAKTGGNTVSNTVDKSGTQGGNSTEHLTRNLTDRRIDNETTKNDTTITTDSQLVTDGTSNTDSSSTQGGQDKTTTDQTVSGRTDSEENGTETRNLNTELNRKTTATNKLLDTPQDNINLMLQNNYLTSAGMAEGTENAITDETGTIDTEKNTSGTSRTTTDGTNTTVYGRTDRTNVDGTLNQTETGTGTQSTDGKISRGLESTSTGSGGQDTTTTRNLTDESHESGNQRTELNETDTTNHIGENKRVTDNFTTGKNSTEHSNETSENGSQKTSATTKASLTSENVLTRDNSTTINANSKIDSLEHYIEHIAGRNGGRSFALTLQEFRETFLNIDLMVIDELNDLFFNLW